MFMTKSTTLTLTLFFYVTFIFAFTVPSEARGFQHIQHHDHANPARFIKGRSPLPQDTATPLVHPSAESTPASVAPAPSTTGTTPTSSAPATSQAASDQTPGSSSSNVSPSQTKSIPPNQPTTTPAKEQKPPAAAPPPEQPIAAPPPPPTLVEVAKPTVTKTRSIDPASTSTSTEVPDEQASPTKTKASNPLSVMVMVGASIAGCAILWTVFRKWKLRRSKKFDARLRPIIFP